MLQAFPFAGAVCLAIAAAFYAGDERFKRTGIAMLLNWAAIVTVFKMPGSTAFFSPWMVIGDLPWFPWLVIDAVTLVVVIASPAGKVQAVIAGLLFGQVLWHAAFGYVANLAAGNLYKAALNAGGWVQVGTLIGGAGYDQGRRVAVACWRSVFRRSGFANDLARVDIEP
jgi:hypothetical protein